MNARSTPDRLERAVARAVDALAAEQTPSGSWKGDYSGPLFLPGLYVGTCHLVGHPLPDDVRAGLVRHLRDVQGDDGSFGLGVENPGTVFTTTLGYVALRLLDVPAHDPACVRALAWVHARGGPGASAAWGKFFLALLGLFPWDAVPPTPPETWLLPKALPLHPGRLWCHARMVYLPMAYLYARRATGPETPVIRALREELWDGRWGRLDVAALRTQLAAEDALAPPGRAGRVARRVLQAWERVVPGWLREAALREVVARVRHEDEVTSYVCLGPVNKLYDTILWSVERPGGDEVRRHRARLGDYLHAEAGRVRVNGYNSSELWDTAFAAQALLAADTHAAAEPLARAWRFVEASQVREDVPDAARFDRDPSRGAWPFSTREHGWPITDCTAEGLRVALAVHDRVPDPLDEDRLAEAVDRLLGWQNPDGSWASYERTRGPRWLEALNPSDVFADIMIDHGHVECTAAGLRALAAYRDSGRVHRRAELEHALVRGRDFVLAAQQPDGGWRGGWGVCFTYGAWFGVTGLVASGLGPGHPALRRAVDFLLAIQHADGSWGEHVDSCRLGVSVPTDEGQAVMTSWALLALVAAGHVDSDAVRRGVTWLLDAQDAHGRWHDRHVAGVFNRTCSIHYDAYRKVFPLWALAEVARRTR